MLRLSSKKIKFSMDFDRVLKETIIDKSDPGSILRDFSALLHYLEARGCPLTGKHQLSMRVLPEMNALLSHPIEHGLERPQQKSFPHINGLFLLMRASGLTFVEGTGKKPLLSIDDAVHQAWKALNHTEQYFSLLETWLLRGRPEIIGDPRSMLFVPESFHQCMSFFEEIPKHGLRIVGNRDAESFLLPSLGLYNLGLLDLFGIISVRHGSPVPGKPWNIDSIHRTSFGDALFTLLFTGFFKDAENIFELEDQREVPFGVLQPVLQPYFSEWKNNPPAPEQHFRKGAHIFKVSLGCVWFRIAIPADCTLDDFALDILSAVEFDDDHLYQFSYRNRFGAPDYANHPYTEEGPWASEVVVGELTLRAGEAMTFLFDFGQKWKFNVILEEVDSNMVITETQFLELHGKPPEQYPGWDE
ncbi:MAG: plasmid pRiA4b ORF-3 family protein [Syntrophobacteraceae bacterium]